MVRRGKEEWIRNGMDSRSGFSTGCIKFYFQDGSNWWRSSFGV